ncbi:MAG: hypothetical protein ACOX2L_11095 [Anaerolineae bacterium]|jgi:hypothetical protein|nr:hypothetical protein [Chloroflexota bacterium]
MDAEQRSPGGAPLTASAVMRFLAELEQASAEWYRALAAAFPEKSALLQRCASLCARNGVQVQRTYQETITDALETNFAFEGLDLRPYGELPGAVPGTLGEAQRAAVALEERAAACYEDVAGRSARLLATIPRVLQRAAEARRRNASSLALLQ